MQGTLRLVYMDHVGEQAMKSEVSEWGGTNVGPCRTR